MYKNSVVITYHNLHPSEVTKSFIESVISEIHHELPRGSKVKASFTAKDDIVKGVLQAGSHGKPFFATATSTNIDEIATRLLMQMRRRLEKFKNKTARRLSIKDLPINENFFGAVEDVVNNAAS